MGPIVERMAGAAARESQLGGRGEQLVADGDDGGRLDRLFEALAPDLAPPGDRGVHRTGMMIEPLADRAPRRVDEFFPQRGVDLDLLAHVLSHPPLGPVLLGVAAVLAQARPAVRHRAVRAGGWLIDPAFGDSLERSKGREFDRLFLQGMIGHHRGAVTASEKELADGQSPEAKTLAEEIIAAQKAEITEMETILSSV